MNQNTLTALCAALLCACNIGPDICNEDDPAYDCDGNILVFCQQGLPEVRLDCDGFPEERTCSDEFQECVKDPVCGNEILEDDEECDDGNNDIDDGCSEECILETICGDGLEEQAETCDDGNTANNDGCNENCQIETRQIICDPNKPLLAGDFNVPDGFVLQLAGECTSKAVILEPELLIQPIPGQSAAFVGDTNITIGDADPGTPAVTVVFRDIDFTANTRGKIVTTFGDSSLAIVNADMSNVDPEPGSRLVNCFGSSQVLIDRVTADALENDVGFKAENSCQMIISNTVVSNSGTDCKKPIELKEDAVAEVLLSTFVRNRATEFGIAKIATGALILNGVLSNKEGAPLPFESNTNFSGSANLIEGANFSGNTNEDPNFPNGSLLPSNPNALDVLNIPFITIFDPAVIFSVGDVNIFSVDRGGVPRNPTTDAGAFEIP